MDTRRPGEQPRMATTEGAGGQPQVGRGRGRAAATIQQKHPDESVSTLPPAEPMEVVPSGPSTSTGGGAQAEPAKRQRRMDYDEPHTRPQHISDKRGEHGSPVQILTNYVVLKNRPGKAIYQYNVSYNPPVESKGLRMILFKEQIPALNAQIRAFDGMVLYLPHRLPKDVTEVVSSSKDGDVFKLTIKLTNELSANSPVCLQLFNVLFRRILAKLEMKQIGRHYYNPNMPQTIPQHRLEVWPGFVTSILQYEKNVMLCADISHKILRTDTVLDLFYGIQRSSSFHDEATKAIVGEIVLTRYNNRTYRVDDIDWSKNPMSTFQSSSGEEVSFMDYYKKAYDAVIKDNKQPLLVSRPRKKDEMAARRMGKDPASIGPVLLIPELCTRTGLSEEARSDFKIMKDVGTYTRQAPPQRIETLSTFIEKIQRYFMSDNHFPAESLITFCLVDCARSR
jgi:aubergine-like protein